MKTLPALPTSGRRLSLALAAGAMALGLAACGSQSGATTTAAGGGAAPAALTATATPTAAALAGKAVDAKALATSIATASAAKKYVHVAGNAGGQSFTGSVAYVDDTVRSHVKSADTEAITIGKTVYVKKAGTWAKQTPAKASAMGAGMPDVADLAGKLGKTVRDLGATTVDGTSVTHYRSTATLAEVSAAAKTRDERDLLASVAKMGITGYTTDLYVGAGNLPAKVTVTVDGAPAGLADSTLTYSGWGTPVSIKAPKTS
jgi:hypothetical protein